MNPEPVPAAPKPVPPPALWYEQAVKNKFVAIGAGVGVAVLLTLLVIVFKLVRRSPGSVEMASQLAAAPAESLNTRIENQLAEQTAARQKQEMDALNALKLPPVTKKAEVLTKHIVEQAKKDSSSMAHVLRTWMSETKH